MRPTRCSRASVLTSMSGEARLLAILAATALLGCRSSNKTDASAEAASASAAVAGSATPADPDSPKADRAEDHPRHPRKPPSGQAPRLSCAAARAVVADVLARLAAPPSPSSPGVEAGLDRSLADGMLDWADPHGLWTASPDSPMSSLTRARAAKIHAVLEGKLDCAAELKPLGEAMVKWMAELRTEYDAAAKSVSAPDGAAGATHFDGAQLEKAIGDGAFEDGAVTRTARELSRELGRRTAIAAAAKPLLAAETRTARDRWLPKLDAQAWSEVLLAAAVRAYVPLVDPHGAWAPGDEAATLYDRDLELAPPPRLWSASTRTALGVRIDGGAVSPLAERDVVLSVDSVTLAGLSAEAIDQLAEAAEGAESEARIVRVVRDSKVVRLEIRTALGDDPPVPETLPVEIVSFGTGKALVIRVRDVPDALGDDLARALSAAHARTPSDHGPDKENFVGVVLDLRGNGGGSLDGATSALGIFLAGAPLFPLKHRDGAIETERATEPPSEDRWVGPVAALVDGGTASAAEMIAGALHAYRRGQVVGTSTYGKGCAQEYVDDASGSGVLRLTTLLFALPDGTAVQRVGLHPDIVIALPPPIGVKDHEADLPRAAPTWSGPDVRDSKRVLEVPWPKASTVGPCSDEHLCKALRALGSKGPRDIAKR